MQKITFLHVFCFWKCFTGRIQIIYKRLLSFKVKHIKLFFTLFSSHATISKGDTIKSLLFLYKIHICMQSQQCYWHNIIKLHSEQMSSFPMATLLEWKPLFCPVVHVAKQRLRCLLGLTEIKCKTSATQNRQNIQEGGAAGIDSIPSLSVQSSPFPSTCGMSLLNFPVPCSVMGGVKRRTLWECLPSPLHWEDLILENWHWMGHFEILQNNVF